MNELYLTFSISNSYYLSLTKLLIPFLPAAILNDKVTITTGKPAKIKQRIQGKHAQVKTKVFSSNLSEVKDFIVILQISLISFLSLFVQENIQGFHPSQHSIDITMYENVVPFNQ